jgi:phosphoglycolate phosphatase
MYKYNKFQDYHFSNPHPMAQDTPRFGIFFDWSGTLSNDLKPVYLANNEVLKSYGKPMLAFKDWLGTCCGSASEFARRQGVEDLPENIQARFKKNFMHIVGTGIAEPEPYSFTPSVLASLDAMGIVMTIISSHPQEPLELEVKKYGVSHHFTRIVGSIFDKSVTIKELCEELDLEPSQTFYVGDTIHDMKAANRANVLSVAVCGGYHPRELLERENPTYVLEDASTLPDLVQKHIAR